MKIETIRLFHLSMPLVSPFETSFGLTTDREWDLDCSTFLVFSDYMKPAIRIAAISRIPSIFVFTHDSVGLGEDGPTHQPIEHLMALRAVPYLTVIRPADANEVLPYVLDYSKHLEAVTSEDIQRVARECFRPGNLTVGMIVHAEPVAAK